MVSKNGPAPIRNEHCPVKKDGAILRALDFTQELADVDAATGNPSEQRARVQLGQFPNACELNHATSPA
jgi:hypothetical protein